MSRQWCWIKANSEEGRQRDELTAYQTIHDAGGICIATHVNSNPRRCAMKGFDFGGQTRIAYTGSPLARPGVEIDLGR